MNPRPNPYTMAREIEASAYAIAEGMLYRPSHETSEMLLALVDDIRALRRAMVHPINRTEERNRD